jgi:hypothetical protein
MIFYCLVVTDFENVSAMVVLFDVIASRYGWLTLNFDTLLLDLVSFEGNKRKSPFSLWSEANGNILASPRVKENLKPPIQQITKYAETESPYDGLTVNFIRID